MRRALVVFLAVSAVSGLVALKGALEDRGGESVASAADVDVAEALKGLWNKYPGGELGDPVRFYYFHDDGVGLYRYGRLGFTNTNSYDWSVEGDVLKLRFRKTGKTHEVHFSLEEGGKVLVLKEDPKEPGSARYVKERAPVDVDMAPFGAPAGSMWIDAKEYATGGSGFSIYQLASAAIDGRGIGWHHRGDFDDWSTEALRYRLDGDRLSLRFELSGERHTTRFQMEGGEKGSLLLAEDPRNWWQRSRFKYMGKSFEAAWAE